MTIKPNRVACGEFADIDPTERENSGTALAPEGLPFVRSMFTMRCRGSSMEPKIRDRMWCLFHPDVGGTRQDRIVLVEEPARDGLDRYTLKRYHSYRIYESDGSWERQEIYLMPLNSGHPPIRLEDGANHRICGWFVGAVSRIQRIDPVSFRYIAIE